MTDNGEILSQNEVDFLLAAAGGDDASTPTVGTEGQTVTMHGDLEQINLADIFQTLAMTKMEGVLRVRNPLEERHVHFRDGHVRLGLPMRVTTRRLGQRLLHAGMVQPEQLRAALLEQRKSNQPLGEVLIAAGLITQEHLEELLATQISEDLFALFTWRHGSFEFWKGPLADAAQRTAFERCPEFEVNSLLLEVARRSDEWQSILAEISSVDEVPRRVDETAPVESPTELHDDLFRAVNGHATYRDLAEQTTHGLFEVARAARDLARAGAIANLDDGALVAIATHTAEEGHAKKALLLLQTLRDRPGERALGVQQGIAKALESAGEKRLAADVLLEAAQHQGNAEMALELAERARKLVPFDHEVLSYLRTVMLAHAPGDQAAIEQVTLQLLDALLENDEHTAVLELAATARATGTASAPVLVREARAHQKARTPQAAVETWLEVAALYDAAGDRAHAMEAYDAVLRLDRSRKDVARLLRGRKRTRAGRLVRMAVMAAVAVLTGTAGFVYWQQVSFTAAVQAATTELDTLLVKGDRNAARERWEHWLGQLGACEAVEDLRNRIAFAEAAERGRQQKLFRARVTEQLQVAADTLTRGEVGAALAIYRSLHTEPSVRTEVVDVVNTRLVVAAEELTTGTKALANRLPPDPATVFDRAVLQQHASALTEALPEAMLRRFDEFVALLAETKLPEFLSAEGATRIRKAIDDARPTVERARVLHAGYAAALRDHDTQRRLDPMFKAAVEKSAAHDYEGALTLFRELARQPVGDAALRVHFQEQVARHTRIVQMLQDQRAAVAAGDHANASRLLRELRTSFPDVPVARLVRLPLRIESTPRGAHVLRAGQDLGVTPLLVQHDVDGTLDFELRLDGFEPRSLAPNGDEQGALHVHLGLAAAARWRHDALVEAQPVMTSDGRLVFVDRRGAMHAVDPRTGAALWTWRSGDLSGLLTPPVLDGELAWVGSVDGTLRAIDLRSGTARTTLPGLPTETPMVRCAGHLVFATTDRRLVAMQWKDQALQERPLGEVVHGNGLAGTDELVVTVGEHGAVAAHRLPTLDTLWQRQLAGGGPVTLVGALVVVAGENGTLTALHLRDGASAWELPVEGELLGAPAVHGDRLFVATPDALMRVHASSGRLLGSIPKVGSPWASGIVSVGDRWVAATREGSLYVLDDEGTVLYAIDAPPKSRPLVANRTLVVVQADHALRTFLQLR